MKTTLRVLLVGAIAAGQWWSVASQQPAVHVIDTMLRQVARPESVANVFMQLDAVIRSLRRAP